MIRFVIALFALLCGPANATTYVLPVAAFSGSGTLDNLAGLQQRIVVSLGGMKAGTTQYFTVHASGADRWAEFTDTIYGVLSALTPNPFVGGDTITSVQPSPYATSGNVPTFFQRGLVRDVFAQLGDSITNSQVGGGAYPGLSNPANRYWSQSVVGQGYLATYSLGTPEYYFARRWYQAQSRQDINFGRDGYRFKNYPGATYTVGGAWLDIMVQAELFSTTSAEHLTYAIALGSNDVAQSLSSGVSVFAVPSGTVGYTYAGSPNLITDALIPMITALHAVKPTADIAVITPIARSTDPFINGVFCDYATYVWANYASLGVKAVLDTRSLSYRVGTTITTKNIHTFDCTTPTVTTNPTYYQPDGIHLTPTSYVDPTVGMRASVPDFANAIVCATIGC